MPRGPMETRAPLTPADIPTPALEKLNRNGPIDVLRRHVPPTASLAFDDLRLSEQAHTTTCASLIKQLDYRCFSVGARGTEREKDFLGHGSTISDSAASHQNRSNLQESTKTRVELAC